MDQNVGPTADIEPSDRDELNWNAGYGAGIMAAAKFGTTVNPGPGLIYAKLAEVMRSVSHVTKAQVFDAPGVARYNFRGIDAVVNALGPALREHGVIVIPELLEATYRDTTTTGREPKPTRETTVKVKYTFVAEDGSCVSATVPGESLDQSDKGSAKAMSVAFRIALLQVFALPTDEPDPDASYHTRDGGQHMSPAVRRLVLEMAPQSDLATLAAVYWPIVREHDAVQRAISPDSKITYAAYFAQRAAELIDQIEVWEEGRDALGSMRSMDNLHDHAVSRVEGGEPVTLVKLLEERAAFIKARRQEAFNKMMADITGATSLEELDGLTGEMGDLLDSRVLSEKQVVDLAAVLSDRYAKLEREQNQMAPGDERAEDLAAADAYREEPSGAED